MHQKKIAIIIPAANEEQTIRQFCKDILAYTKRIPFPTTIFFIVDTVSQDTTFSILQKIHKKYSQIQVIYAPKNRNVVDAYIRGYKEAINKKFDFIIEMDCGFSHLPSELHQFIEGYLEGYDCIFGIRSLWSPSYPAPLKRRLYSLGGTILANLLLGTRLKDMTSGYEAFTYESAKKIFSSPLKSTGHFFQTEVRYRARKMNYKEVYIHYNFPSPRVRAESISNSIETLGYLLNQRVKKRIKLFLKKILH